MNNNNNKQNRQLLDRERGMSNQQFNVGADNALAQFRTSMGNSSGLRENLLAQYENPDAWMGGVKPNAAGWFDLSSMPGAGGGGADFGSAKAGFQRFADTGGRENFDEALGGYRTMAGGHVPNADAIRYRATSAIPSFYDKYKTNLARRANVQGGYSPGFDSQTAEIGRQAGREAFNASRMAEADIADRQSDAMKFGISGIGNISSMINSGQLSGLSGLKDIAATEGSLAESAAGRNQGMQQFLMGLKGQSQRDAIAGKEAMYRGDRGEMSDFLSKYLQAISGRSGTALQNLGTRSNIQDRSWMDLIGPMAGLGSSIFTGFGGFGPSPQPQLRS